MNAKEFLLSLNHINHSSICREIGVDKSNFSRWLQGKGNIPLDKLKRLEEELKQYGYKK